MHYVEYPVSDNMTPGTTSGSFALAIITITDNSVTLSATLN